MYAFGDSSKDICVMYTYMLCHGRDDAPDLGKVTSRLTKQVKLGHVYFLSAKSNGDLGSS